MRFADLFEQLGQVFTRMFSHTQKKREDPQPPGASGYQIGGCIWQGRRAEFQVGALYKRAWFPLKDLRRNSLDRPPPLWIPRTVGEKDNTCGQACHRLSTSHPNAPKEMAM